MKDIKIMQQYQKLIDEANIVSKTNSKWIITYVNDKFCEISWYNREELIWKSHNIVRHPDMPKEAFKDLWDTIKNKKQIWDWIVKNKKKDWGSYWVKTIISPILDENWDIIEYISIRTDITDLEIAKNKLKQSFSELKQLDQKKDDFLNISSHELRTPMTSIKWYLSMIIDWDIWKIDDEAKFYLSRIYSNVENLLWLINDMLDITKIESWKMQFTDKDIDIKILLEDIVNNLSKTSLNKGINIKTKIDYDKIIFMWDESRLRQAIVNILWNAIKFTHDNWKIEVKSFVLNNVLNIIIKDNWIWIAKKDLKGIFNKFWQIKNSLTRDIWWTWLWLSISKAIVEYYNWEIEVKSRLWKGSEFNIILPIK